MLGVKDARIGFRGPGGGSGGGPGLGACLISLEHVIRVSHLLFLSSGLEADGSSELGLRYETLCHGHLIVLWRDGLVVLREIFRMAVGEEGREFETRDSRPHAHPA